MRKTLLKARVKNAFLHSLSTPSDRGKAPVFGFLDALEILLLVIGVLVAVRYLVH